MPKPHTSIRSILLTAALVAAGAIAPAANAPAFAQTPGKASTPADKPDDLTPEEKVEREARKDCKVKICAAFRNRQAAGGDIACNVLKSWRKEQLTKLLEKAKVSWPWGRVRCSTGVSLKRDVLIKAMTEPKFEAGLDTHKVVCEVDREGADKAEIKFEFTPKVTFENGLATKAVLGWGKIEAPSLVKGAMWTATATDNTFNVLQSTVVEDINSFIGPRCDEVKTDWAGK